MNRYDRAPTTHSEPATISGITNEPFVIASMTPVNVVMKMPAMRAASQEDHQRIFAAIMGRDPAAARDAMQAHLARVVGEFTQAWR